MTKPLNMFLFSNLGPSTTGIEGVVLWVSAGEFDFTSKDGPRIKVVLGDKLTSEGLQDAVSVKLSTLPLVLGELPGKVRRQVLAFVSLNLDTLLDYWNNEISTCELLDRLESNEEWTRRFKGWSADGTT